MTDNCFYENHDFFLIIIYNINLYCYTIFFSLEPFTPIQFYLFFFLAELTLKTKGSCAGVFTSPVLKRIKTGRMFIKKKVTENCPRRKPTVPTPDIGTRVYLRPQVFMRDETKITAITDAYLVERVTSYIFSGCWFFTNKFLIRLIFAYCLINLYFNSLVDRRVALGTTRSKKT